MLRRVIRKNPSSLWGGAALLSLSLPTSQSKSLPLSCCSGGLRHFNGGSDQLGICLVAVLFFGSDQNP
jgi:hypothetical protein